jgi:8-oxo-dGTP pyrophosphatase MutT (NUDIX family)
VDFNNYYKNIKKELSNLPGESAHLEMIPFRLQTSRYSHLFNDAKLSAVMCLILNKDNEFHIILIERQTDGGRHSGQISFPGGKKDIEDIDLQETALRETEEEIGIAKSKIEVLGELTQVYIPVSNFLVKPFIGVVLEGFEYVLSENEVKSVFKFSIEDLIDEKSIKKVDMDGYNGTKMKNIPCFILDGKIVWGATAIILNEVKTILKRLY